MNSKMPTFGNLSHTVYVAGWVVLFLLALLIVAISGCSSGEDGPRRHHVSGTVEYDGQPLPAGKIFFEPDTEQGNRGPGGYADIVDGRFDTRQSGKGAVGGPHVVRMEGFDGQSSEKNDFHPKGNMLFPVYRETVVLPEENSEHTFVVERK